MEKPESITTNDWKLLKAKYKNLNKVVKKLNKKRRFYLSSYIKHEIYFSCFKMLLINLISLSLKKLS